MVQLRGHLRAALKRQKVSASILVLLAQIGPDPSLAVRPEYAWVQSRGAQVPEPTTRSEEGCRVLRIGRCRHGERGEGAREDRRGQEEEETRCAQIVDRFLLCDVQLAKRACSPPHLGAASSETTSEGGRNGEEERDRSVGKDPEGTMTEVRTLS